MPMPQPLVARARGVRPGQETFAKDVYKKFIPAKIDFDTHPLYVPGTSPGLFVLLGDGSGDPSGNIVVRESGYYRFTAQLTWEQDSVPYSLYLVLVDAGPDGSGTSNLRYANYNQIAGCHPITLLNDVVRVDLGGAAQRYYYFNARYVSSNGPPTWKTQTGHIYSSQTVEYLGAL